MLTFKVEKKCVLVVLFLIIVFALIINKVVNINDLNKKKILSTSTQVENIESLNNTKICWGIKRASNHKQPDVGSKNKEIMDKYNGICIGNNSKSYIYLTFDMGYEAGYTEKILEVLKQNNVKATFFITAHYLNSRPDLVKRMIDEGHIVGNHTVNHKSMPECNLKTINSEVMDLHKSLYEKYQYEMKYIRPPKGEYSERTVAYTNTLNYTTVMWSFAYDDWEEDKQGREEYGKAKIIDNLHNGEIMLLHGTSKDNSNILDSVLKTIKEMNYEFKSLDDFEV